MLPANATAAWPVESTRGVAQHAWISPPSASGSGLREPAHRPAATSGRKIRRFSGCFETAKRQWSVWRAKACAALLRRVGAGSREDNASKQHARWIVPAKYGLAVLDADFGSATPPERVVSEITNNFPGRGGRLLHHGAVAGCYHAEYGEEAPRRSPRPDARTATFRLLVDRPGRPL